MTAPTLDELRRLRCELAPSKLAVSTAVKALLDCEIARREGAGGSEDGLSAEQLIVRQYERLRAALENEPLADNRMGESTIDAQVRAAIEERDSLRAKLAAAEKERDAALAALSVERERSAASTLVDGSDAEAATAKGLIVEAIRNEREKREAAEAKRDEWERGYDAMSAEVAKIRTALVGLTLPRADLTAEVEALREALRVEREACDRAAGLIDDDESESRRQWRREYDARRAAERNKSDH